MIRMTVITIWTRWWNATLVHPEETDVIPVNLILILIYPEGKHMLRRLPPESARLNGAKSFRRIIAIISSVIDRSASFISLYLFISIKLSSLAGADFLFRT